MATVTAPTMEWPGASGKKYKFWVYKIGTPLTGPGNYIFTRRANDGTHSPIYIGETEDLNLRFDQHHKASCITREKATHICAHKNANSKERLDEETDLVRKWNPPCNG